MEVEGRFGSLKVTLCFLGEELVWGTMVLRLSFLEKVNSPEAEKFPPPRTSSPERRNLLGILILDCFFCGAFISTVGAVVMISGAVRTWFG